jgi:penicillin-binding protein 1A
MDPRVAYVVGHMMQGICNADAEVPDPTGRRTAPLERPRAGKTGTTNQSRNTWFCGFTPEFTTIVWIGYRDNRPLGRGLDYTGGRLACPIWTEFMVEAHKGLPVQDFTVPEGVEFHNIYRVKGTLGGPYREAYVAGNPPPAGWAGDVEAALEDAETGDAPEMNDLLFGAI